MALVSPQASTDTTGLHGARYMDANTNGMTCTTTMTFRKTMRRLLINAGATDIATFLLCAMMGMFMFMFMRFCKKPRNEYDAVCSTRFVPIPGEVTGLSPH